MRFNVKLQSINNSPVYLPQDQNLNRNLGDLEEGTKSRNRIFQKRIVSERHVLMALISHLTATNSNDFS